MSKTDSLLRLLAILRFSVPSNSSRMLNATQAYDVTSSGITLASAIGKLLDKDVAVKTSAGDHRDMDVGLSVTAAYTKARDAFGAEKKELAGTFGLSTAIVKFWGNLNVPNGKKETGKCSTNYNTCGTVYYPDCCPSDRYVATTLNFNGTAPSGVIANGLSNKPKATNPNTVFYGAITVGTGDYKKWQGKYAVLKINTVTGKGVLRIYDA